MFFKRAVNAVPLFALAVVATVYAQGAYGDQPGPILSERAAAIHAQVLTVDTHIDWPIRQSFNPEFDPSIRHETGAADSGQWDLPRMEAGQLDAAFMSIFTPQKERSPAGYAAADELANQLIDMTEQMVARSPDKAELALTPEDAYRIEQAGKRAIFLGMENGYPLGTDIDKLNSFYERGIRYITLTHSLNNDIGDSSTDEQPEWGGLSPFGETVVQEMNRLGMMIDISHVHDDTFWDVIRLSQAPVIASHSSAQALRDVPRNMNDDMLKAIQINGGVVQLCLLDDYIKEMPQSPEREAALAALAAVRQAWQEGKLTEAEAADLWANYRAINQQYPENQPTLADALDHLDHMVDVMGIDHVGIGSDFDGGGGMVDIEDVAKMPNITQELLTRGYTAEEIEKIWGGNLIRVFQAVIDVAASST